MQAYLGHIQFNVQPDNLPFYKELFDFLGWSQLFETDSMVAVVDKNGTSFWFIGAAKGVSNDYDGPGVNHLGISVSAQADVDAAATYLTDHNVTHLFGTPQHRPDFSQGPDHTYYQVMFESPDRILFEIVYIGPKS